jgi:predicted unusual protein kinase regulating ubiquinone biosynthesis (AarF/ABC1/UbiB family)
VLVLQLTREAAESGLRMDPELVMLGKTLLNLGQVAAALDPGFEPREALRRHTSALMRSSMETSPASLLSSVLEAKEFVEELPGRVNRAFDAIGSGRFELRVNAFDEDEFLRGLHKLANVGAAGLILASLILASALLARSGERHPGPITWVALAVFVISVVVGLAMLVSIWWRSRKVHSRR